MASKLIDKEFKVRGHKHFFNTMETIKLGREVLKKVRSAEVENGHIIVYYSDEGMCIFEVLEDTEHKRLVEFISTAS